MAVKHESVKTKKSTQVRFSKKTIDKTKKELVLKVPCGGQIIRYFDLTPQLPVKGVQNKWSFVEAKKSKQIGNIDVGFCDNNSHIERYLERAILIVRIKNDNPDKGLWRFAMGGVATFLNDSNPDNDLDVQVIDNGFTLIFTVEAHEDCNKLANFQFVASYTETATGIITVYQSDDPGIGTKRPA
jgi:hypothetical protein